jgi:predicted small secreted protein
MEGLLMRLVAVAVVLLAALLSSCAAPSNENVGRDDGLYEAAVQAHVDAMAEGMARARLDLARREIRRRLMQTPG